MKQMLLAIALLAGVSARAAITPVTVADSTVSTAPGIGGYTEVAYAFAKGDKVTLVANSSKQLERIMVVMDPNSVLLRVKDTRKVNKTFGMPEDGKVYIRFISDRGGVNNIRYSIVRLPASEATQGYDTRQAVR